MLSLIKIYLINGKERLNWNLFIVGFRLFNLKFTVIIKGFSFFKLTDPFN